MIKVLMFHSIGNALSPWYRNWLSVHLAHFEHFCRYLSKNDYKTILLSEWYYLQNHPKEITGRELVLTFDDGYLDNWVYAYPILKKYGLRGTVFVNPEFVDPSTKTRDQFDPDSKSGKQTLKNSLGFLNWDEIIAMDKSGIMDIQSHSMSHNFYFSSKKIIDIYEGQNKYDWIAWYTHPNRKPFYLVEDQSTLVPYGQVVFEYGRALGLRRYFPAQELLDYAVHIHSRMKPSKKEFIDLLNQKLKIWPGVYENDKAMEMRYRYEIFDSKHILEQKLNKKVDYLCWPGGGYNDLSIQLSVKAGYKASTIASRENPKTIDNSIAYKRIPRSGTGSFITTSKHRHLVHRPSYLTHSFLGREGKTFFRNINRTTRLYYIFNDLFKR